MNMRLVEDWLWFEPLPHSGISEFSATTKIVAVLVIQPSAMLERSHGYERK